MKFVSTLSQAETGPGVAGDLAQGIEGRLGSAPDLAVLFFTSALVEEIEELVQGLRFAVRPGTLVGVSCEGVIGGDQEIERRPAASLLAGTLPGVTLRPFHIGAGEWRSLLEDDERLQQRAGTGEEHRGQLILADPFTTPVDDLLSRFDALFHKPTFGGMASGGPAPGANALILNDEIYTDGAIGIGFGGSLRLDTVVSQGCRPVGEPMVATRVDGNLILELGRRPALQAAQEMLERLPREELELVRNGLFIGVAINEYRTEFHRGDFLVRGLMGADPDSGALAVGDSIRAGQTIQFQVRDATTAHEDLVELLGPQSGEAPAAGGLLFSCNGRGTRMFPEAHHDARTTLSLLPGLPLAGFFAMGELGPIGGKSFIHGHTASFALFRALEK
jgi:small ligand-binding sensory domain FIST